LGTSEEKDAREYFANMEKHMISFQAADEEDRKAVELAFSKKQADARKEWLRDLEVRQIDYALSLSKSGSPAPSSIMIRKKSRSRIL
jgi:hypothetical protein